MNLLLENEGSVKQTIGAIAAAPGQNRIDRLLKLPGTNQGVNLSAAARKGKEEEKKLIADLGLPDEEQAIQNVYQAEKNQDIAAGHETKAAFKEWVHVHVQGNIPYARRARARDMIREGVLDNDEAQLVPSVRALGGADAVYGEAGGTGTNEHGREIFERAAEKLERAAAAMESAARDSKASSQARPTLNGPGKDPGMPVGGVK
jgi:hypothetical protein